MPTARLTPGDVRVRHRVEPASMERMAPAYATEREPPASPPAEAPDGVGAVEGARRLITAPAHVSEDRTQGQLVGADEEEAEPGHRAADLCAAWFSALARSRPSMAGSTPPARAGTDTTASSPAIPSAIGASAARTTRRARFRSTAVRAPNTASPARKTSRPLGNTRTRTRPWRLSTPARRTAANRPRPRRRWRWFTRYSQASSASGLYDGAP